MVTLPNVRMEQAIFDILSRHSIPRCAGYLCIAPAYLRAVLSGHHRPSGVLKARIEMLAKQLKQQEPEKDMVNS